MKIELNNIKNHQHLGFRSFSCRTMLLIVIALILFGYNESVAQPGHLDLSFDPGTGPNTVVFTSAVQPDGKIIIGGAFTEYNGTARSRIARLNKDGSLDTSFDPGTGANEFIETSSIQSDGKIIIGGEFTSFNGAPRSHIARLNTDGSLDTTFNPGTGANFRIWDISIQDDEKIIIGGNFITYNGTARGRIARLNADGSLDTSFDPETGANNSIYTTSIQDDGKIIIGGDFTVYNGTFINRIARLNTDGSLDTTFDPGTGANVIVRTSSIQSDGKIIIGGTFTEFNGTEINRIARLNTDGSLDTSFDPGTGANSVVVTSSIQTDGRTIIGGLFTEFNGTTINHIARLNTDGSLDTTFIHGTGASNWVHNTSIQSNGKIIIVGYFGNYNGTTRRFIARLLIKNPVGVNQLVNENKNVKVFPNPFSSSTTLHTEVDIKNAVLTVYNSLGQTVIQKSQINLFAGQSITLDRRNLPGGLYFIQLSQDNKINMSAKIVITD